MIGYLLKGLPYRKNSFTSLSNLRNRTTATHFSHIEVSWTVLPWEFIIFTKINVCNIAIYTNLKWFKLHNNIILIVVQNINIFNKCWCKIHKLDIFWCTLTMHQVLGTIKDIRGFVDDLYIKYTTFMKV